MKASPRKPHVVIIGGGFGGLYAAKALRHQPVRVTLVDKRNFHLFQPLLYQVATGALSPADIATPLRTVLASARNIEVVMDEMVDLDPATRRVILKMEPSLDYDLLVLATGSTTHYFGHEDWSRDATGLKTVEDALDIRRRLFNAFEAAEREPDPEKQKELMTFVLIGGGPTGVEMAGALAELAHHSLPCEFRHIDCRRARIILVDAAPHVLGTYPPDLSEDAEKTLTRMGVEIRTGETVTAIAENRIRLSRDGREDEIRAGAVVWSAGVKASPMGMLLADKLGCRVDRGGRVIVAQDCTVPGHPEIFVIGDLAGFTRPDTGKLLPGVAAVAIQQGHYVGQAICSRLRNRPVQSFQYHDKGSLAVIGLHEAIADLGKTHLHGFTAWIIWAAVHIRYLIGFDNKFLVMFQWAWSFLTRKHSARLITGRAVYD